VNRTLTPELAATVDGADGAKDLAGSSGELLSLPAGSVRSPFDAAERELVAAWHSSGEYDRIVAEFVTDDPDLATE
jgi:hypothetical protein